MHIRLETNLSFDNGHSSKGIFAAMGDLKKKHTMSLAEHIAFIHTANWFNHYLPNPRCFIGPFIYQIKFKAQCWFKLTPMCYLFFIKSLSVARLLHKHNIKVRLRHCTQPKKILYEDKLQIVTAIAAK